ncbi:class I SAM-dependent methyltransferase [Microbacterium sp. SD291]|uniref:class I SAM-dependent methyltransferase n=1 Tax=Microbacterium sp. SD291 TaxID=2782007 RepID=UPI001A959E36|nr:class I SAM-dependent methyltransferase [Microbacterium sp. SD291]MBO0980881.1 class I SAM-dependent methyltransferase [Microbacterium sp. SD291]
MSKALAAHYGAGGDAPYDFALRNGGGTLRLIELGADGGRHVEIGRFLAAADAADDSVISRVRGPVLDVGCGPGRMVHAAIRAGHLSLGVDVSRTAVERTRALGLPALHRSVFDHLPQEGSWRTLLLLDGNIGIGGAPQPLLTRCAQIVSADAGIIVEVDPVPATDRGYEATVVDDDGRSSSAFPWYDVGADALRGHLGGTGLQIAETWAVSGRAFVRLARA